MTKDEANAQVIALAKLFPGQITDQQGRVAAKEFRDFAASVVTRAVEKQRRENQFVNWPQLYRDCKAFEHEAKVGAGGRPPRSWCDDQRRNYAHWNGMTQAGDVEVVLRVHRQLLHEAGPTYRGQMASACRSHLVDVYPFAPTDAAASPQTDHLGDVTPARPLTGEEAARMAEWIDRTAELIFAAPDVFRMALEELRQEAGTSNVPGFSAA